MAYAFRDVIAQYIWFGDSGLATDVYVNTWAFRGPLVPGDEDFDGRSDVLHDFYTVVPTGGSNAVANGYSSRMTGLSRVKWFRLTDPEPRAPVFVKDYSAYGGIAGTALPSEVSIVASFQAPLVSGLVQARRRGRVFLGPFGNASDIITSAGIPAAGKTGDIIKAMKDLYAANEAVDDSGYVWSVNSRANAGFVKVTNGWVDNAFDTQRRRGEAPTSRSLWP